MIENGKCSVGLSVNNFEEFLRVVCLRIVDHIEVKLDGFHADGTFFYHYKKEDFIKNDSVLKEIAQIAKQYNVIVNFHLTLDSSRPTLKKESGINVGVLDHHLIALRRMTLLEIIYREYGLGSIITMHPPMYYLNGVEIIKKKDAIINAQLYYEALDMMRIVGNYRTKIAVENCGDTKRLGGFLGYKTEHFEVILAETKTIWLCFDSGHSRLAKHFNEENFFNLPFRVANTHFHGNAGDIGNIEDFEDDDHALPAPDNVTNYHNNLRLFKSRSVPITLELLYLEKYSGTELINFVKTLRAELKKI